MAVEGFFEALGEAVGSVIRFIVEGLGGFFGMLSGAISSFIAGMSKALGVTPLIAQHCGAGGRSVAALPGGARLYPSLDHCRGDLAGARVVVAQRPNQLSVANRP